MKKENGLNLEKLSYCLYFAGQICIYCMVGVFISTYMTDIGIPLAAVGIILVLARVWDAINDPLFGIVVDKFKWKSGDKYLPWIRLATGLILASSIAIFICPDSAPVGIKTVWVGIAYVCWGMSYTICDIPIYALPTRMTDDTKERSMIISFGRIGCTVTGGLITLLLPILRKNFGWSTTGVVICVIGALLMLPASINIKENKTEINHQTSSLRDIVSGVKNNKYLIIFYCAFLINGCLNITNATTLYFARYCLGDEAKASITSLCTMIPSYLIMVIVPVAIRKFDKFKIFHVCMIASTLLGLVRFAVGYENEILLYVLMFAQGIFLSITMMLTFMFTPDIVEYGVFKNGPTGSGVMYSIQSFSGKLTSAIGGSLCVALLGIFGFKTGENAVQSANAIRGIWVCSALVPAIGSGLSALILLAYKLRDKNVQIMAEANSGRITREEACERLQEIGWTELDQIKEDEFITEVDKSNYKIAQ